MKKIAKFITTLLDRPEISIDVYAQIREDEN